MKMLDFNAIQQPTWPLKLRDEDQTVVNLLPPSLELVERLQAMAPALNEAAKTKDGRSIRAIYQLVADIMNINDDGFNFTAEELRDRYHLRLLDVFQFVAGYLDFIKEMNDAKN